MASTRSVISPGIFAEDASTTIPPVPIQGVSYRDPAAGPASAPDGWPFFEKVNSAEFNQLLFQYSSLLDIMDKQGVLGWTDLNDYDSPALVYGSNGLLYFWLQESGPGTGAGVKDPVSQPSYWQHLGGHDIVSFTSAGVTNWTVPLAMQLGIIKPKVTVIGAGHRGSRIDALSGGGGSSGSWGIGIVDLTGVASVTITVGQGGTTIVAAGSSSFGAYISAPGGGAASDASGGGGQQNSPAVGGDINERARPGGNAFTGIGGRNGAGTGGASPIGTPGFGASSTTATVGQSGTLGSGGGGSVGAAAAGAGGDGVVIIEW